jgi:two-component sensor histidine kinase
MQVVGSLLSLQAVSSTDEKFLAALADIQDRIRAMALVHEKLYRSGNFTSLNLRDYVIDLMASLLRTHPGTDGSVRTNMDLEDIFLSIDTALPCGLIINELVSNSLKHAFPGRESGAVFLSLRRIGDKIELRYRDDGPGLPPDLDLSQSKTLGLKLVYNLAVLQLHGKMEIQRSPATEIVITFGGLAPREGA